tara:strand:+ start:56 stop:9568 length:9513 start_codon:yes stop_codon:yes gene_type:complete
MSRQALYTEIYKKYATDLTEEEIAEKANYAASVQDQQAAIDTIYEKYTGNKPSFEQRLYVSKVVDPSSINSIIEIENKKRGELRKKYELAKKEQDAINDAKKEEQRLKDEEVADIKTSRDFEWDVDVENKFNVPEGAQTLFGNILKQENGEEKLLQAIKNGKPTYGITLNEDYLIPGSDEQERYKNRLEYATSLKVKELKTVEANLGNLITTDGGITLEDNWGWGTGDSLQLTSFDDEGQLTESGLNILAEQKGVTIEELKDDDIVKAEKDYEELKALDWSINNGLTKESVIDKIDNPYDTVVNRVNLVNESSNELADMQVAMQELGFNATSGEWQKEGEPTDEQLRQLKVLQDKTAELERNSKSLNRETFSSDEEFKAAQEYKALNDIEPIMLNIAERIWETQDERLHTPITNAKTYAKRGARSYNLKTQGGREKQQDTIDAYNEFMSDEEKQAVADAYGVPISQAASIVSRHHGGRNQSSPNGYRQEKEKAIQNDLEQILQNKGYVQNTWNDGWKKAISSDTETSFMGVKDFDLVATQAGKDQAATYLGDMDEMSNLSDERRKAKVDEAYQEMISGDAVVKDLINKYAKDSIPKLEAYKKELLKDPKFNPNDVDDIERVNNLMRDKQNELTIGELINDEEFIKRSSQIGLAIGETAAEYDVSFGRQDSMWLSLIDSIRGGEDDGIPFNDSIADILEGVTGGVEGIKVSIADKAKGSWHGNQLRAKRKRTKMLKDSIASGEFSADDKVIFRGGKYVLAPENSLTSTAQQRLDRYNESASYHQEEIVEQIEDMAESEEYTALLKQANFDDGIGFQDVFLTLGQALPHITLAAGGTALGAFTGGTSLAAVAPLLTYAGTAMMGLQMYGDNYWSAIEQNLADKGLSKEALASKFPDASKEEINEMYKKEAIANLESGEGANMFESAAFAAAQTALESYGAQQMVNGTVDAIKGVKGLKGLTMNSLYKSSWDDIGNYMLRGAIEKGGNALEEFGTEYMQEILGQVSTAVQSDRKYDALIDTKASLQSGIGGAITGFVLPFAGQIATQSKNEIRNMASDFAVKYRPGSNRANSALKMDQWFKDATSELNKKYKDKETNADQKKKYYEELNALNNVRTANLQLTGQDYLADMSDSQYKNLLDTQTDINAFEIEIEKARKEKNKPLEKALREEQSLLVEKNAEIIKAERTTSRVANVLKDLGKSQDMIVVEDESALKREANKRNIALDPENPTVGFFTNDGQFVVDKKTAADFKEGNTAAHELLHKVLFNTLYDVDGEGNIKGKNVARGLAAALDTELDRLDPADVQDSKFKRKLELYKKNPAAVKAEEKIVLFADAIESGDLKFNENVFTKIGDQVRRFLQAIGIKDVKFNSGKDVYNFLKDYNASIKKGKLNQAQKKVMNEGAEVGTNIRRFQGTEGKLGKVQLAKSNKALNSLANTYQENKKANPNIEPPKELRGQYTAASLDALQRWAGKRGVPFKLYTPQGTLSQQGRDALSAINKEFPAIMKTYKKSDGALTTYLDKTIGPRVGTELVAEATRKSKQVSQDVLTEKGVSLETTEQKEFDSVEQKDTSRKKKYPSSLKSVNEVMSAENKKSLIGGVDASGRVTGAAKSIIQGVGQNSNPESVAQNIIASTKDKSVMQQMRKDAGKFGTEKYNNFVDNVVDEGLTKTIPAATIKRRLGRKANVDSGLIDYEQTGTTPTKKIDSKGKVTNFNKPVYKINKVDNTKLKEYYKAGEKRQQSLYSMLAEGTIVEGFADLKNDTAFMNKLSDTLELKGVDMTADQYMSDLENSLDQRTKEDTSLDIVKANKALKTETKVEQAKSYVKRGMAKDARTQIKKLVDDNPLIVGKGKTLSKADQKRRRMITVSSYHNLGPEFHKASTIAGATTNSMYQSIEEATADLNGELDAEMIADFKKQGIPVVVRKGKTYYDKSKAKSADIKITDKNGKEFSTIQIAQNEQLKYKKWSMSELRSKIKDPVWKQAQVNKLKVLKNIAKTIAADIKANPENIAGWAAWLESQVSNSRHPIRALAPIKFFSTIFKGAMVAEHTLPANQVASMILGMAKRDTVNRDFKDIAKDYYQGKITKKQDNLLKTNEEGVRLGVDMPNIFFNILNPSTWLRYLDKSVNAKQGGINMNTLLVWDENGKTQTLTESFGVGLTPSQYNMANGKVNQNLIQEQNNMLYDMFAKGQPKANVIKERLTAKYNLNTQRNKTNQAESNSKNIAPSILNPEDTTTAQKQTMINSLETTIKANKALNKETKGISVFDFDDTLAKTKEKVIVNNPNGTITEISASEFAQQADILTEAGATFDFSNFEQVSLETTEGPLADLARKRQGKFGSKDIFVLTARPQVSAGSIKTFLDAIGINIPIENITGLEDGSPQAKADWVLNKTAEGYNDFYFADDSFANVAGVKAVLDAVDVKSKVQVAKANKAVKLDTEFNKQLENVTGKEAFKEYSTARAKLEGKQKDGGLFKRFMKQFTITPSADDFMGLMYGMIGKGETGNNHIKFIKDNLIDVYNKAEQSLMSAKITVANDFAALKKQFPSLKSKGLKNPLLQPIGVGPFTKSQAMRVYMWNKQGMDIPGMSKRDINNLVAAVEADNELNVFADEVILIQKDSQYPPPGRNWLAGDIKTDILQGLDSTFRSKLMSEFNENADIIFSEKNLNKIEALYGSKYREALEDSLRRMKSGTNRPVYMGGGSRMVNEMLDWLNSSVGAVMFFNMRSGLLQTLSSVNFINWGDNNMYAAGKAFASKAYFPTVLKLLNSDYLVNRRDGLKINVNEAELADAGRKGGIKGMINYILDKGFAITRVMDSVAIATGGATFFINRKKALLNRVNEETGKLYTEAEAEAKAFDDFYAIAEETQQSSNPSKISQQQASMAGRLLLSFQNVTMQYNRKTKKSIQQLFNRRKNPGMTQRESDLSNLSSIIYYVGVQNLVFNALQQALFAMAFDEEEDDKEKNRTADVANGMLDSLLFGLGFGGAIISTVKNIGGRILTESEKKTTNYRDIIWDVFNVSPVIDSKIRKLRTTAKTFDWNMKDIKKRGWSLDNPAYLAITQLISATTNVPLDRVLRKAMNISQAFDEETRAWQRVALLLGWSGWNVGLPYWGRQSTIDQEAKDEEKLKTKFKNDVRKAKASGFTKRVPFTGPNSGKPKGELGVDYIAIERYDGKIQYYKKP